MLHRVLIVDDYPDAAEATSTLLTILGHVCKSAANATEALAEVKQFDPDIAIVDIGLPDLSGLDLGMKLRGELGGRGLYLAALTGWGAPDDVEKSRVAGFDQHLLKPASMKMLCDVLARAETKLPR